MQTAPNLFDRRALSAHRDRVANRREDFLRQLAADDVEERLKEVNRTFTAPVIVSPHPENWAESRPEAKVVFDAETLDLESNAYDVVIHDLCLHWSNDPVGQLVQCRRALRPDGLMIATLLGGRTLQELRTVLAEAEAQITGGLSPRVAPMADIRDMGGLLQRAGFALPVADSQTVPVSYQDAWHLMRDLRAMGETNAQTDRVRHFTRRAVLARAAELYAEHFNDGDRIRATFEIVVLTGWAPSESQPKALRPGSATTRLADVLGTQETPLERSDD